VRRAARFGLGMLTQGGDASLAALYRAECARHGRAPGPFIEPPAEWRSPESALEERRFFNALERCLQTLPGNTARAFTMRELLGLETDEICKELRITPSNCWVMLYRARMNLRACLERTWFSANAADAG
jgi:RNA polymerase sigma-70 factor (ECF subfamily)